MPHAGEPGAETWPAAGLGKYGGVHNWSESTVDVETGTIYIPTGTARYDFYGANREGANLYGNSLLALDARSGKLLWHFQAIHHDLWDYDFPTAPKLLTVQHDGATVPIVAQPSKQGFVYVFNRITGVPLWPIEERAVPQSDMPGEKSWPTQPFPTAPPPFARQSFTEKDINPYISEEDQAKVRELLKSSRNEGLFTPPSLQGTIQMPGHNGGANWGSSAVDPRNGRLFVVSKELPVYDKLRAPETVLGPGGGAGGGGPPGGGNRPPPLPPPNAGEGFVAYVAPVDFMIQPSTGLSAIGPPWSQITAYDLNKGTILWQIPDGEVSKLAPVTGHRQPCAARRSCCNGRGSALRRHVFRPHVPRLRLRHGQGALVARVAGGPRGRAGRLLGRRARVRRDRGRRQRPVQPEPQAARARPGAVHGVRAQRDAEMSDERSFGRDERHVADRR